jgi:hypothetical protein
VNPCGYPRTPLRKPILYAIAAPAALVSRNALSIMKSWMAPPAGRTLRRSDRFGLECARLVSALVRCVASAMDDKRW